ncbi:MAG TPA: PspA/IM30 family protein, partial [Pirellulales bacterium]
SSITTIREKVEDPERMLHQLLVDMEEEQCRVRRSVAEAIADEIQLGKQVAKARAESETWLERATSAMQRGDEANAQAALSQKLACDSRAAGLDQEYGKQKEQTAKLHRAVRDLEDKIRQAKQKRTLLLARLTRSESARRIDSALSRCSADSAFASFERLEERVDRSEALTQAHDRLADRDPDAEELARKFEEQQRKDQLQVELAELKRRVQQ